MSKSPDKSIGCIKPACLSTQEDREDLSAFDQRTDEPTISYKELLEDLKSHGKL